MPTLPYTDPLKSGRHPFQTYLLALCVISGTPMTVGATTPGSVEDVLPLPVVIAWGIMLVIGSGVALTGTYWHHKGGYATAMTMERIGLWACGVAALAYSLCIMWVAPMTGAVAAFIVGGFGAACIARARDIGQIFKRALSDHPKPIDTEPGR